MPANPPVPSEKAETPRSQAAKSRKGSRGRVRVSPVREFPIFCHSQQIMIPPTGIEVEFDAWIERQVELGCLKEL